jgi:hypothetical protein
MEMKFVLLRSYSRIRESVNEHFISVCNKVAFDESGCSISVDDQWGLNKTSKANELNLFYLNPCHGR